MGTTDRFGKLPGGSGMSAEHFLPHIHVDAGNNETLLHSVVAKVGGCVKRVLAEAVGQQRLEMPEVYNPHTPFDFRLFTKTSCQGPDDLRNKLSRVLGEVAAHHGSAVEAEQPVLIMRGNERIVIPFDPAVRDHIGRMPFPATALTDHDIELHFLLDIDKRETSGESPLSLPELIEICDELQIPVGGWFQFQKKGRWAFRSNTFLRRDGYRDLSERYHAGFDAYLRERLGDGTYDLRGIAEAIIGIWKI